MAQQINPYLTCSYILDKSSPIQSYAYCTILQNTCGMTRYCNTKHTLVMSDLYNSYGCTIKNKQDNKDENNLDINIDNTNMKVGDYMENNDNKIEILSQDEIIKEFHDDNVIFEEKIEEKPKKKVKVNTQTCKIRLVKDDMVYFEFIDDKGAIYVLQLKCKDLNNKEYIEIKYKSMIGKEDFSYYI